MQNDLQQIFYNKFFIIEILFHLNEAFQLQCKEFEDNNKADTKDNIIMLKIKKKIEYMISFVKGLSEE